MFPQHRGYFFNVVLIICGVSLSAEANYGMFLKAVHGCLQELSVSNSTNPKAFGEEILEAKVRCNDSAISQAVRTIAKEKLDCAKTAVKLRNLYKKNQGEIDDVSEVSTARMALKDGRFRKQVNFTAVTNSNGLEAIKTLQPGDMLYFDNVNCIKDRNRFLGHLITVLSIERNKEGIPIFVNVLEGHTGNVPPTFRKMAVDDILDNQMGAHSTGTAAIPDITCSEFRGISSWKEENAKRKGPIPAENGPRATGIDN